MLFHPWDGERAAVHQHHDERLSRSSCCFEQFLLQLRQTDSGSVTATEAFKVNRHLFPFQTRRQAYDGHDHVSLISDLHRLFTQHASFGLPLEVHPRPKQWSAVSVFQTDCMGCRIVEMHGEGSLPRGLTVIAASLENLL